MRERKLFVAGVSPCYIFVFFFLQIHQNNEDFVALMRHNIFIAFSSVQKQLLYFCEEKKCLQCFFLGKRGGFANVKCNQVNCGQTHHMSKLETNCKWIGHGSHGR